MAKDDDIQVQAAFTLAELKELIDSYTDNEQKELFDYLRARELRSIETKVGKVPDLSLPEFKIFDDKTAKEITEYVLYKRRRRYTIFCYCYSHPQLTDDQIVDFIKLIEPDRSFSSCVRDLNKVKFVLGNMPKARKELIRFQVIEMLKRAYQKAESLDNPDAMASSANAIGRNANLSTEDNEIPWDEMIPPDFEPTDNIKVLSDNLEPYTEEIGRASCRERV